MSSALCKQMFKSCFSLEVPVSLHIVGYSFVLLSELGGAVVKNLPASVGDARDMGSIPGSGRSLENEMATHSSILAWKILWTEEPGGLKSMGLQRVRCD